MSHTPVFKKLAFSSYPRALFTPCEVVAAWTGSWLVMHPRIKLILGSMTKNSVVDRWEVVPAPISVQVWANDGNLCRLQHSPLKISCNSQISVST